MKELSWYDTVHRLPVSESDSFSLEVFFFFDVSWFMEQEEVGITSIFFLFQLSYFSFSLLPLSFPDTLKFSFPNATSRCVHMGMTGS